MAYIIIATESHMDTTRVVRKTTQFKNGYALRYYATGLFSVTCYTVHRSVRHLGVKRHIFS